MEIARTWFIANVLLLMLLVVLFIVFGITSERDCGKLEEKIAETNDHVVQKRLQEVLDKKKKKQKNAQKTILIFAIIVSLYISISMWIEGHFERKKIQMETEHIQLQREMLNR